MNRLLRLSQLKNTLSIGAGVIIAQRVGTWIEQNFQNFDWLPPVIALVIVATCFQVIRFIFELLFENSKFVRKVLLGYQYVEGVWIDIISSDNSPILFGVSRIDYTDSSICIDGEDFDQSGNQQGHYVADMIQIEWPTIKYKFTYQQSGNIGLVSHGYGELQFMRRDGCPKRYTGCYFELLDSKRITYEGWKLEDKGILKQLDKAEMRKETVISYCNALLNTKKEIEN